MYSVYTIVWLTLLSYTVDTSIASISLLYFMHYCIYYLFLCLFSECFGAALIGISTIRAFDKAEIYVQRMYRKIDTYAQAYWHLWLFNCWRNFRLNVVSSVFATVTTILIVSVRGVDASLAGLALSFALEYTVALVGTLRHYANSS